MRPLRLLLDGFGTYHEPADLDFSDVDLFALVGPTGAGKSTVIDGICFALYGTVPRWGKANVIAHALAPSATTCRVCFIFEAAGNRYAAVRLLTRDRKGVVHTKEARLDQLDDAVDPAEPLERILEASVAQLAEGPDTVNTEVHRILGLSYEHFTQCVLLPQGKFAEFLHSKPADRQDLLVRLLAYGVYDQVGQRARERAKLAASRKQMAQAQRDALPDVTKDAEQQAKDRASELSSLDDRLDSLLQTMGDAKLAADQAEAAAATARGELAMLTAIRRPDDVDDLAGRITVADKLIAERKATSTEKDTLEADAEAERAQLPDKTSVTTALAARAEARALRENLTTQNAVLGELREKEQAAVDDAVDAGEALAVARDALEHARRMHAAAHLASGLRAGDDCPVCRRPLTAKPRHPRPADLDAAQAAIEVAESDETRLRKAADALGRKVAAAEAQVTATQARLAEVERQLTDAPAEEDLEEVLAAIDVADTRVNEAREAARKARAAVSAAETQRKKLADAEAQARRNLYALRDELAALRPPAVADGDLAFAWDTLLHWASEQQTERESRQPDLDTAAAARRDEAAAARNAVTALLAEHGIDAPADVTRAPVVLAEQRIHAEKRLEDVRATRKTATKLDKQIAVLTDEEHVANLLGQHLDSRAFERWLCSEALDALIAEASDTLRDLSGGQYELDRDAKNDIVVIDYNDAGTTRPVHTLSGGETFQASLAFALALSRQVVDLSAGLRELNSIFLDEGFGTLDEAALETVAETLETLAADHDRMVGLVTHLPALAARVPVQFRVTRDGTTSRVAKIREATA